ncbi:MAG: 3-isopropylmalate dehydrogenase [Lautropia sp.]
MERGSSGPIRVLVLGGDGVGPEVIAQALRVGEAVAGGAAGRVEFVEAPYGMRSWQATGEILPQATLEAARAADAILFGAVGDYPGVAQAVRRAGSILRFRTEFELFVNLRPVRHWPMLADTCPLRPEVAAGTDIAIVRENTGGLYFGTPRGVGPSPDGGQRAINTLVYTSAEIERVARFAFELARTRSGRVCSVDKSNVLENGQLWREVVGALHAREFPDLALSHMLVDNCAMQLVRAPSQFDVIVTDNMFGDILSDGAGGIAGSLGMLPSASLGLRAGNGRVKGVYEPVHGSAPDIAGTGVANPLGAILSLAMLMRHSVGDDAAASRIERAVERVLALGLRTPDIAPASTGAADRETATGANDPMRRVTHVGTVEMGDAVLEALDRAG